MPVVKWTAGKYKYPVTITPCGDKRLYVDFRYNPILLDEVRNMQGAKYHGYDEENPRKIWSIAKCPRNDFQMRYLAGENPYTLYEKPLVNLDHVDWAPRTPYPHQIVQVQHILTYHNVIIAAEMGLGKTLSCILAMELAGIKSSEAWYVGPKAGVYAVGKDLVKWSSKVHPTMFTYDRLVSFVKEYKGAAPKFIIFDETQKIKTPQSQRSMQAMYVADCMRDEYGWGTPDWAGYVVLLTGTPAPKSPLDWWHQCEVACPGYLKEGSTQRLQKRMAFVEQRENLISGGVYPHVVTWWDDENKCAKCGQYRDTQYHGNPMLDIALGKDVSAYHTFEPSKNEVSAIYRRMKGLALVQFKKDCTNLPEKRYEIVRVKPTAEMLRASKMIANRSTRAITALTLLRELSDGFQYTEEMIGREECPTCHGRKTMITKAPSEPVDIMAPQEVKAEDFQDAETDCEHCSGTGSICIYKRGMDTVSSPKDQVLLDDLDEVEGIGRYVVWGGFTGTIDRLVELVHRVGWATLRIDGRGFVGQDADGSFINANDLLSAMDLSDPRYEELLVKYPKVCTVGHPEAGGVAITLTATPIELYYSNSFKGDARSQSEDRGHRLGMDINRGLLIKDVFCLKTDELVYNNLQKKKRLQDLSMGQLFDELESNQEK